MDNETKSISFKGTAEGLVILIPKEMETGAVMTQVAEKVRAAEKFFRGAKLNVIYRGKKLTGDEEQELIRAMTENSSVTIEGIRYEETPKPVEREKSANISGMPIRRIFFKELEEGPCKFVRGTIRSGTRILYEGNVVVIGDANPGSEIVASGNIVVFGALRGMVHAGADGNRDAIIAALKLAPTQLRIGDIITRCPDTSEEIEFLPEIALVKDGIIYVEPL
ncbi:MAG: septum site-determining protein MinC [Clostridiaceae bacterium]|jgi:septum site-determining protein MinC|nr:septum site-determining protein MinC [Clostridiaceae bacterium]